MKIMNISSLLRTLPKLLALLVAIACTLPLIHAKVGEQENWYLDRIIEFNNTGDGFFNYYAEVNGSNKLYKFDGMYNRIQILDFNGSVKSYETPYISSDDNSVPKRSGIADSVVLPDGTFIISTNNKIYHAKITNKQLDVTINDGGSFTSASAWMGNRPMDTESWDWETGNYLPEYFRWEQNLTMEFEDGSNFDSSKIKGVANFKGWTVAADGNLGTPDGVFFHRFTLDYVGLENYETPPTSLPTISLDPPLPSDIVEERALNIQPYFKEGLLYTPLEESVPNSEKGGYRLELSSNGKLLFIKSYYPEDSWDTIYWEFKIYQLAYSNNSSVPNLVLDKKFTINKGDSPGDLTGLGNTNS